MLRLMRRNIRFLNVSKLLWSRSLIVDMADGVPINDFLYRIQMQSLDLPTDDKNIASQFNLKVIRSRWIFQVFPQRCHV